MRFTEQLRARLLRDGTLTRDPICPGCGHAVALKDVTSAGVCRLCMTRGDGGSVAKPTEAAR